MSLNSFFKNLKEKVFICIENHLDINVREVPILYVNNFDFYKCIKSNYKFNPEDYVNVEIIKSQYKILCEVISGLYKWKEKSIYIKEEARLNFSLLLAELLHSQSITQGKSYIEEWISEGLPHYLTKIFCKNCSIKYIESGHQEYFPLWEKVHKKHDLIVLKTILFSEDIIITENLLKFIFEYEGKDMLQLSFKKAKDLLSLE